MLQGGVMRALGVVAGAAAAAAAAEGRADGGEGRAEGGEARLGRPEAGRRPGSSPMPGPARCGGGGR